MAQKSLAFPADFLTRRGALARLGFAARLAAFRSFGMNFRP